MTQRELQNNYGDLITRRQWTVSDATGEQVSFRTDVTGVDAPDVPFVRALTAALGWTLPT